MGEGRKRAEVLESSSSYSKDQVYQAYGGQPSEAAVGVRTANRLPVAGFCRDLWGVPSSACTQHTDVQQRPAGIVPGRREVSAKFALHVAAVTC